jgi:hypothetical protein
MTTTIPITSHRQVDRSDDNLDLIELYLALYPTVATLLCNTIWPCPISLALYKETSPSALLLRCRYTPIQNCAALRPSLTTSPPSFECT